MRQRRARATTAALALPSLVLGTGLLTGVVATPAAAQRAAGVGTDAFVLPRGALRITLAPTFVNVDERFLADGSREPIGAIVGGEYDAARLGILAPGQQALRDLTRLDAARLTLGNVRVTADQRSAIVPLGIELGLGARVQLGVMVPYVRTTTNVVARADDRVSPETAGFNPALARASARDSNSALVVQLLGAARAREEDAGLGDGACAGSAAPECATVNDARDAASALARLYGTDARDGLGALASLTGSAAVPRRGTANASAIDARLDALRTALGGDASGIAITRPAHAVLPLGGADLRALTGDPTYGLGLDAFRLVERSHLGDVEASAKVALIDGIGRMGDEPARAIGIRVAVMGLVRAPTGQGEQPGNALDVGTGDGQTDVELGGAVDVTIGRALWISGAARAVRQMADDQFVRATSETEGPLAPASATQRARRDLGDAVELEITPRWMPNAYFTIAGTYQLRRKGADRYEATQQDGGLTPGVARGVDLLGAGTEFTEHRGGFGVTWSTLNAGRRGSRVLPLDVSYVRVQSLRATGGITPLAVTDQLRLRLWFGATGRR